MAQQQMPLGPNPVHVAQQPQQQNSVSSQPTIDATVATIKSLNVALKKALQELVGYISSYISSSVKGSEGLSANEDTSEGSKNCNVPKAEDLKRALDDFNVICDLLESNFSLIKKSRQQDSLPQKFDQTVAMKLQVQDRSNPKIDHVALLAINEHYQNLKNINGSMETFHRALESLSSPAP